MIELHKKYGCLTVLDGGEEYRQTEHYHNCIEERKNVLEKYKYYQSDLSLEEKIRIIEEHDSSSFASDYHKNPSQIDKIFKDYVEHSLYWDKRKLAKLEKELDTHYKCKCKCGKIHFYNEQTLDSNPRYCFYPVSISTKFTYSIKANNATYNKRKKYSGLENVVLLDATECDPSDVYCEYYNKYKERQLTKKEQELNQIVANLPRVYAQNYDVEYAGMQYETLLVEKCVNDHLESEPRFSFSQQHKKRWHSITVFKQYKCKCSLCGKEQLITCDKFGIYPPTEYGYHAYNGYWSDVYCDCHPISSFQWILNKLLIENHILYQPEYTFEDLVGRSGNNLRYDFAILNGDGSVNCLIECHGEQHYFPVEEFGGKTQYDIQVKNDQLKKEYAEKKGIPLLIISYKDKQYQKVENILKVEGII